MKRSKGGGRKRALVSTKGKTPEQIKADLRAAAIKLGLIDDGPLTICAIDSTLMPKPPRK